MVDPKIGPPVSRNSRMISTINSRLSLGPGAGQRLFLLLVVQILHDLIDRNPRNRGNIAYVG